MIHTERDEPEYSSIKDLKELAEPLRSNDARLLAGGNASALQTSIECEM